MHSTFFETMGNKQKKSSGGKKKKNAANSTVDPDAMGSKNGNSYGMIMVDPARCRFQHSKIRPYFSGCGRSIHETLENILEGKTKVSDLPPIQVLVGDESMDDELGPWYFSLNNRRLWVLKRLREQGHLEKFGNKVAVRVRRPNSQKEKERYTLSNCALEARLIPEKKKTPAQKQSQTQSQSEQDETEKEGSQDDNDYTGDDDEDQAVKQESDDESDDDEDDEPRPIVTMKNRFANMMMDDSSSDEDE